MTAVKMMLVAFLLLLTSVSTTKTEPVARLAVAIGHCLAISDFQILVIEQEARSASQLSPAVQDRLNHVRALHAHLLDQLGGLGNDKQISISRFYETRNRMFQTLMQLASAESFAEFAKLLNDNTRACAQINTINI